MLMSISGCAYTTNIELPGSQLSPTSNETWLEVDVFSGRPNPRERLAVETANDVYRQVQELAPTVAAPIPDQLGYRGMLILQDKGYMLRVYQGTVFLTEEGKTNYFLDTRRTLERRLLQEAKPWLEPDLYEDILNEFPLD